jgi:hypothetical protein
MPGAHSFFGNSREDQEAMQDQLEDLNEIWRNEICVKCGLARKIVVHSDTALDEWHHFERGERPTGREDNDETR